MTGKIMSPIQGVKRENQEEVSTSGSQIRACKNGDNDHNALDYIYEMDRS